MKVVINYENLDDFCNINDFKIITDNELKEENMYVNFVYATADNFLNTQVYPDDMPIIINKKIWEKLKGLNRDLKKYDLCITIYDAFRPIQVQQLFWDAFYQKNGFNDEELVANPNKYGTHNIKFNAVDIIPTKLDGSKIEMPSEFDDFTGKARVSYNGCSIQAKQNRKILISLARKNGLIVNPSEWWHYTDERILSTGLDFKDNNIDLIPVNIENTFKLLDN